MTINDINGNEDNERNRQWNEEEDNENEWYVKPIMIMKMRRNDVKWQ